MQMEFSISRVVPGEEATPIKFVGYEMPSEFSMEFHVLDPIPGRKPPEQLGAAAPAADDPPFATIFASGTLHVRFQGGRPRCDRLVIDYGSGGIRSSTLRAIPIAELLRLAVMIASRSPNPRPSRLEDPELEDFQSDITTALRPRRGRRGSLNPNVAAAAGIYREEVAAGRKPGPTIAAELHVTHSSARRLVSQARAAGLLGDSLGQGRLGEQPPNGEG